MSGPEDLIDAGRELTTAQLLRIQIDYARQYEQTGEDE